MQKLRATKVTREKERQTTTMTTTAAAEAPMATHATPATLGGSSSSSLPEVHLFLSSDNESQIARAEAVCKALSTHFGLTNNVVVRSALVPADRLLQETTTTTTNKNSGSRLYVVLGLSTCATSLVETDSAVPLVSFPTTDPADSVALSIAKLCSLSNVPELQMAVEKYCTTRRQARIVHDAQLRTKSPRYLSHIMDCIHQKRQVTGEACAATLLEQGVIENCQRGKVRDRYTLKAKHRVALVTTDRQSGFDRALCQVPFKGAVLNLTSAFWFEQTSSIIPNHVIAVPQANVTIARTCQPFPIEFVMRSYMTGSTSTSIWKNYQDGIRNYCGHILPDGMVKNQKLATNLLTPTTKEEEHDRPISLADIVAENWMTPDDLDVCAAAAALVFALGQQVAAERGLILVDTKYEFGKCNETGEILLIDEVHTPDSSRYWLSSTYEQRIAEGQEPDNIDKEFLRLWYAKQCDPYKDKILPDAPADLVSELSRRYILLYELIVGKAFDFEAILSTNGDEGIEEAIRSIY